MKSEYICDDRRETPEEIERIRNMSDEEFEEHLRKLREENMDD